MHNRNASLVVYDERDADVVPPFLVGEIAGSLMIESDRKRLREFAEAIIDWLERTERDDSNVVRDVPFGMVNKG